MRKRVICKQCGAQINRKKLLKHRKKVHGFGLMPDFSDYFGWEVYEEKEVEIKKEEDYSLIKPDQNFPLTLHA